MHMAALRLWSRLDFTIDHCVFTEGSFQQQVGPTCFLGAVQFLSEDEQPASGRAAAAGNPDPATSMSTSSSSSSSDGEGSERPISFRRREDVDPRAVSGALEPLKITCTQPCIHACIWVYRYSHAQEGAEPSVVAEQEAEDEDCVVVVPKVRGGARGVLACSWLFTG